MIITKILKQVFSNSVGTGLRLFQKHDQGLSDCESTAWFCDWINKMFDALNRKRPIDGVEPGNHDFKVTSTSFVFLIYNNNLTGCKIMISFFCTVYFTITA